MFLNENRVKAIELLSELNLLKEILPEIEKLKGVSQPPEFHSEGDVWTHTLLALENINNLPKKDISEELVWTVLLHDTGKPETQGFRTVTGKSSITFFEHDVRSAEIAEVVLKRLHFSHHFIGSITWAISQHMRIVNAFRGMSERKIKKLFSDQNIQLLLNLTFADLSASLRPAGIPEMEMYESSKKLMEKFEKDPETEKAQIKKFTLVTGADILEKLKIQPGPEIGKIKKEIEQAYLDGKISTRKDALEMLEGYKSK
jgi:poly(A) polymerase